MFVIWESISGLLIKVLNRAAQRAVKERPTTVGLAAVCVRRSP